MLRTLTATVLALTMTTLPAHAGHHAHHHAHHHHRARVCPYEQVPTLAGVLCLSQRVADNMKGFIADVVARGFKGRVHCYAPSGHVPRSLHYVGEACDFAQRGWNKTVKTMYHVGDLAAKWNLRDGCTFKHPRRDCGHVDSGRVLTAHR